MSTTDASGSQRSPQVDVAAAIIDYWWQNRKYIAKVMLSAIAVFVIVLLLIPNRFKANSTVIVLPPRFLPEVRTQPLTVSTVRRLLESGGMLQQVLDQIRATRTLLEDKLGKNPSPDQIAALAKGSPGDVAKQVGLPKDDLMVEYLTQISAGELQAIFAFKKKDLDEMTVDDLSKLLSSEETVEKKTAADLIFSPLVQLYAIGDSGTQAQLLANTWAILFERMYDELTRQKTTQQYTSILKQQKVSQAELEDIQTTIVRYKANNNLELLQRLIDENSEDLRTFSQQLVVKTAALERMRGRLVRLQTVVQAMEENGVWLGRSISDESSETVNLAQPAAAGAITENLNAITERGTSIPVEELYQRIRYETLRSSERLTSAIAESTSFYREYPVALMEQNVQQLQKNYLDADSRLRSGKVRVAVLRDTLANLDEQLSTTPQYLSLSTAVPEEAVGTAIASGKRQELGALSQVQFRREEINPVWQQLQTQKATASQDYQTAIAEVAKLSTEVPAMEQELRDAQNKLYQAKQSEVMIKENLERWQKNNEQLFRNYVDLSNDMTNTAQELALLEQEVRALDESTSASHTRVIEFQQQYDKAYSVLQVLELRQRAIQRQADVLLQKSQEAQTAVTEDVSDISLGPPAVAPERHYFPQRGVFLVIATIITAGILLGLLARQRYLTLSQG